MWHSSTGGKPVDHIFLHTQEEEKERKWGGREEERGEREKETHPEMNFLQQGSTS